MTVSKLGAVKVTGVLGDGTGFSSGAGLSKTGEFPIYATPYHSSGLFQGWAQFADTTKVSDFSSALRWKREQRTVANPGPYDGGFEGAIQLSGASFVKPLADAPVLNFAGPSATFSLGDGAGGSSTVTFTIGAHNAVVMGMTNPSQIKIKLNTATGYFSGTFVKSGVRKPIPFNGAFLQGQTIGEGFYLQDGKTVPVSFAPTQM